MATKSNESDENTWHYGMLADYTAGKRPKLSFTDIKPGDEESISAITKALVGNTNETDNVPNSSNQKKFFADALPEYFSKAQIKPQTKATYLSKLNDAKQ